MKAMATMKKYKGAIFAGIGVLAAITVVIMSGLIVAYAAGNAANKAPPAVSSPAPRKRIAA